MSHPEVLGVVVIARNGDRTEAYQDPITYQPGPTLSTPLGEVCYLVCPCGLCLCLVVLGSIAPTGRVFA